MLLNNLAVTRNYTAVHQPAVHTARLVGDGNTHLLQPACGMLGIIFSLLGALYKNRLSVALKLAPFVRAWILYQHKSKLSCSGLRFYKSGRVLHRNSVQK